MTIRGKKATAAAVPSVGSLSEMYEGRRKYPRIVIDTPVLIQKSKKKHINAAVHDISLDGVQVRCNRESARLLHPSGKFIKENKGPEVEIAFYIPFEDGPEEINVFCQIYYLAVIPDQEIAFGLIFKKFRGNSGNLVDRFIMETIAPIDDKIRAFLSKPRSQDEITKHMKMESSDVEEVLGRLRIRGDVVSYSDSSKIRHLKLSSALGSIFDKLSLLEERLSKLENTTNKKKKTAI